MISLIYVNWDVCRLCFPMVLLHLDDARKNQLYWTFLLCALLDNRMAIALKSPVEFSLEDYWKIFSIAKFIIFIILTELWIEFQRYLKFSAPPLYSKSRPLSSSHVQWSHVLPLLITCVSRMTLGGYSQHGQCVILMGIYMVIAEHIVASKVREAIEISRRRHKN